MLSKDQIEQTLKSLYSREHWKDMLADLFVQQSAKVRWESKAVEITLGTKTAAYRSKNLFRLGSIELADGKVINVYEAEVQNTSIAQNRVGLRSLVQSEIIPGFNDAAVAVFHSNEQTEWRFTFISKWEYPEDSGKVVKHETHPKKFTYVLGPLESCRTARDRFYELQAKPGELRSVMDAFSVTKLSKEFFDEYRKHYNAFNDYLKNSPFRKSVFKIHKLRDVAENEKDEKPIRDFVKRLLGRIVFLYFVQKKGWMQSIWAEPGDVKPDHSFMAHLFQYADKKKDFYSTFLVPLFFKTLNKKRRDDLFKIDGKELGKIPYLNGGLFEEDFDDVDKIGFKNKLFEDLFDFFNSYNFTIIEDSPDEREVAVDPEMLGHIFENLIEENKKFGTYYTPKEVVHFMTQEALLLHLAKKLLLKQGSADWIALKKFVQYKEQNPFIKKQASVIDAELDSLKVCDPAIGSGAFPMGILLEVFQMKLQIYAMTVPGTPFIPAEVKEKIIRNSIYGVDIDKGAIDIARLRFWLSLIVDLDAARPLPNFDYKFMQGDSLKEEFEGIPLKFETKAVQVKLVKQVDLFGKPVNPQVSISEFVQNGNFSEELDVLNLEEKLFNTHDSEEKEKIRKELLRIEKKFLQHNIDLQLEEAQQRLKNLKDELKKNGQGITEPQKKQLADRYQKKIKKEETEVETIKARVQGLKELNVYEKPYFLWHLYFKHVFDNGGFDIVIANPPYGVKVDDELYTGSGLGSKDSYGFFIKLAIDTLLKAGAVLVYIVSDTCLTIKTHFELRQIVLKNQLHKVIRLHPDTFGAVVNTCIISLWTHALQEGDTLIAADLTNLSTRKNTPEFREKLWHLEEFVGEFNERYAIYSYPQHLIQTNSNLPMFSASPKLFRLMNDLTCDKEKRTIKDGEGEKEIDVRKIKMNDKEIELVRFGDVADVKVGLQTSDNDYYLYQKTEVHGSYKDVAPHQEYIITDEELNKIQKNPLLRMKAIKKGFHKSKSEKNFDKELWFAGRYIIPFDKGGESDTEEGWLPNYYVPTNYFIDWSSRSVYHLLNSKLIRKSSSKPYPRNIEWYFKKGITYSPTGNYSPTFRINSGSVFGNKGSTIFSNYFNNLSIIGILCSRPIRYLLKCYKANTVESPEGQLLEMPFPLSHENISNIVAELIKKQKATSNYDYFSNAQKEIDALVCQVLGLNDEDIQEIEYWWARRYPKLARFADTKPRLNVKDQQELQARLTETIVRGENKYCEFKSSLSYDVNRKGTPPKTIEHSAFKNIAAFLNSEGGTLIIGVDDTKTILGLETTDYINLSKPDKQDAWGIHLDNLIQNYLGNKFHEYLKVRHVPTHGKTVAIIEVGKSAEPAWLNHDGNQEFYIRRIASAVPLSGKEAVDYIKEHWK